MKYQSIEEWMAKGEELFGEDIKNWKFECPRCGKVSSGVEFQEVGADMDSLYDTCIGRHNNKETGCNWAAYGFFKTMGKGNIVVTDEGKEVDVFSFAD